HPEEHAFVLTARAEIATVLFLEKQAILRLLQLDRKFQPLDIERGFVKVEKALDNERVIVGEGLNIAAVTAIVSIQNLARGIVQVGLKKFCGSCCNFQVARFVQHLRAACISRNHQTVPSSNDLVVEMRPRSFRTNGKQFFSAL